MGSLDYRITSLSEYFAMSKHKNIALKNQFQNFKGHQATHDSP